MQNTYFVPSKHILTGQILFPNLVGMFRTSKEISP